MKNTKKNELAVCGLCRKLAKQHGIYNQKPAGQLYDTENPFAN